MKIYIVSKVVFTEINGNEYESKVALKAFDSKEKGIAFICDRVKNDREEWGLIPVEDERFWSVNEISTLAEGALVGSFSSWCDTVCYAFEEVELV